MSYFHRTISVLALASITAYGLPGRATSLSDLQSTVDDDTAALSELMANPAESIPTDLLKAAKCVASLHIIKAGLVWGGRGGHGIVSCKNEQGEWSNPAFVYLGSASWGLQIGVEVVDLTLVFTNRDARDSFEHGNFTLGATGGIAAGPVGRELSGGTNYKLEDTIYSYSRSRGFYLGLTLEGSTIQPSNDYNEILYGTTTPSEIFKSSVVGGPAMVQPYLDVLNRYSLR